MSTLEADLARWRAAANRFRGLRWVGVVLFACALVVFGWHVVLVATAQLPWWKVIPCLLGLGLSLGSFGAADDSAIHALSVLDRAGALDDPGAAAELAAERAARPARVESAHHSPKAALILPLVAGGIVLLLGLRAAAWVPPVGDAVEALP